jgi:hypothetical protein
MDINKYVEYCFQIPRLQLQRIFIEEIQANIL